MTDRDDDGDDEERETLAGDTSVPQGAGTEPEFDLESLPGRRPPPRPAGPAPPQPSAEERPSTETPTREIDVERELPTIVGEFATPTTSEGETRPPDPGEAETVVEGKQAGATGPEHGKGTQGTDATGRTAGRPWKSPLSKAASRTVRDPIVGTAAQRGTQPFTPGAAGGGLSEGQLLADRYELVERLGKGGMGEVWKARHILLQGTRAIKVIKASISKDPTFRQRFLKEGQTMMRVKHPGVVEVTDLDETRANRELFMVMEYLKGRTIYDAVRSTDRPLAADVRDAVRILREVALGMQRIHDERIVHKDLKTDNVLLVVGDDGLEHPKVIDFGLAKSMGDADAAPDPAAQSPQPYDPDLHTTLSGTLAYMAPEQFRHEPSSFRSDIYAFGVMAYEVFSRGEFPLPRGPLSHYMDLYKKDARPELLAKKRPDLDPRLTAILDRCLATKKEERPESFTLVAADLQFWLDTPERERRRKQRLTYAAGVSVLVAGAVWGIFFAGETTAALSDLAFSGGGADYTLGAGRRLWLPGAALGTFETTAAISGKPGRAALDVDGKTRDVEGGVRDGKFTARADLSDLADGEHKVSLRPSPNASASAFVVEVDRVAPKIRGASVKGGVVGETGVFSNSQSPVVVVDVDEAADRIASVVATPVGGGTPSTAQRDGDAWVLLGTASADGKVELDLAVRDRAGNESRTRFAYVRDTTKPSAAIDDLFAVPGRANIPRGVHVRQAKGGKMRVVVDEPAEVSVAFGGGPAVVSRLAARGAAEFDVPTLERDKPVEAVVAAKDAAGNTVEDRVRVDLLPDVVRVMDVNAVPLLVVKGDAGASDATQVLVVFRTYAIGDGMGLWATKVRDAGGQETGDAARRRLELQLVNATDAGHTEAYAVPAGVLEDGVYSVTATVAGDAQQVPLQLVVDSADPVIESVSVALEDGRAVADGGFALAPDVVVTAVVSDLSPERITLDGAVSSTKAAPGLGRHVFRRTLPAEGPATLTLVVRDMAGHSAESTVTLVGDWSAPELTLTSPASGAACNDRDPVAFAGTCSEPAFKLRIEGVPGAAPLVANCDTREFSQRFQLPAAELLTLSVTAEDPAGHRSAPVTVAIPVAHLATELQPEVTWAHAPGFTALMEKVVPGDVVIGGRVRPVGAVFVDKTEVTNRDYRAFLAATGGRHGAWCHADEPKGWDHTPAAATWTDAKWNGDDLPVVNVAYWDAFAFAAWTDRRLPTEAEWVKAAAKSKSPAETELRSWPPFGPRDEWRNGVVVTAEWAKGPVSALAGADVSPVGCVHMGGNVAEWVELPETVDGSPAGTRGGSWFFTRRAADVRNTPAKAWDRSFRSNTIGLRCAVNADRVQP